jgi:hypothetical protein
MSQSRLACYVRLHAIDSIERLVQPQPQGPAEIHPGRAVAIEGGVIPQHREEVYNDKHETAKSDLISTPVVASHHYNDLEGENDRLREANLQHWG